MTDFQTAISISIGFVVYYAIYQLYSEFIRAGMIYNTPNAQIAKLRNEYKVNIRTFQKNGRPYGFSWFRSIWINESIFSLPKAVEFIFFHEYYHLKHNHKAYTLFSRLVFSFVPLFLVLISWQAVIVVWLTAAMGLHYQHDYFERKANAYAKKMTYDDVREQETGSDRRIHGTAEVGG